jgi:flagellar biosynthesis/type III secretory pathway chaperone
MNKDLDYLYNSLLIAMGQEHERYQELLETIKEETEILKKCVLADILDCNAKKERVLLSLNMALEMRMSALNKIAAHLHLENPVFMTQIIASAQHHIGKYLMDYQEKFADLINQINEINENNKHLITFSLSFINSTISYISSLTSSCLNYSPSGQIKAGNLHGRLISQAG